MYVILILVVAIVVVILISIAKVYRTIPLIELKRRARAGQEPAKSLYKVASYRYSSQFLLLSLATIASAVLFVILDRRSPSWVAFIANLALIWLAYIWIPRSSINIVSQYMAQILARPIGWVLQYIHPPLNYLHKMKSKPAHTGLYERADILRLLSAQQKQSDNRIEDFEIDLLKHVVDFGHKRVLNVMTPKRRVHAISVRETLGPIVLSELHKSNHRYFPVYEGKPSNIVGTLGIVSLAGIKMTVGVDEVMNQAIYYVHEEQTLGEVLQIMIRTSQELFIVINSLEEYSGIITAKDILRNLVGEVITEEFDEYNNREFVAKKFTAKPENETKLPEDSTEVLE
jgi:CBS domain containing-hemolysin-like protein